MRWNRSISLDGEQPITAGSGYSSQIGNPVAHWDGLGNGEWRMANGKWQMANGGHIMSVEFSTELSTE